MEQAKDFQSFNFIHIPKCGGTSFRQLLSDTAKENKLTADNLYIVGFNKIANDKHISQLSPQELSDVQGRAIKVVAGHHKYMELEKFNVSLPQSTFHYTILRDPIERFISHYNFFHYKLDYHNCKGILLNDLEESRLRKYVNLYANLQIRFIANVLRPKAIGIENMIKIALFNLYHEFAAFGILEFPIESRKWLARSSPDWLPLGKPLPFQNRNKMQMEVSDNVIQIIREENAADCSFYNHALEHLLHKESQS